MSYVDADCLASRLRFRILRLFGLRDMYLGPSRAMPHGIRWGVVRTTSNRDVSWEIYAGPVGLMLERSGPVAAKIKHDTDALRKRLTAKGLEEATIERKIKAFSRMMEGKPIRTFWMFQKEIEIG